jgi:hypothetical protein
VQLKSAAGPLFHGFGRMATSFELGQEPPKSRIKIGDNPFPENGETAKQVDNYLFLLFAIGHNWGPLPTI